MREDFDGSVEGRLGALGAFGDDADFPIFSGEKCHDLGRLGVIDSAYANSQVLGQHDYRKCLKFIVTKMPKVKNGVATFKLTLVTLAHFSPL